MTLSLRVVFLSMFGFAVLFLGCSPPEGLLQPTEDDPAVAQVHTMAGDLEFLLPGFEQWAAEISPKDTSILGFPNAARQTLRLAYPGFERQRYEIQIQIWQNLRLPVHPSDVITLLANTHYPSEEWIREHTITRYTNYTWVEIPSLQLSNSETVDLAGTYTDGLFLLVIFHQYQGSGPSGMSPEDLLRSIQAPRRDARDYFAMHDSLVVSYQSLNFSRAKQYFTRATEAWMYNPTDYQLMAILGRKANYPEQVSEYLKTAGAVYRQFGVHFPMAMHLFQERSHESPDLYLTMEQWEYYQRRPYLRYLKQYHYPPVFRLDSE